MSFLIIDSDQSYSDRLAADLLKQFGVDVHIKESVSEGVALLELLDEFNFLIAIKSPNQENFGNELIESLNEAEVKTIPVCILIGTTSSITIEPPPLALPITTKTKEIIQVIKSQTKFKKALAEAEEQAKKSLDYTGIPIRLFEYLDILPTDTFLKLKKEGKDHFLKRYSLNDSIDKEDLNKLIEKEVKTLYIEKKQREHFFTQLDNRMSELATSAPSTFKDEAALENYAFESLASVGVSESSLEVARHATTECQKRLDKDVQFQKNLKEILRNKTLGLRQLNSKVISLLSTFIIKGSEFDDSKVLSNLVMASYLQDVKLDDELCSVRTEHELQSLFLNDKENVRVDNHAKDAADELEKYDRVPSDVIKIVRQHHGSIDGKGLPNTINPSVFAQSVIFLLAEETSFAILKAERKKINLGEVFEGILLKYGDHKLLNELVEQFKKNLMTSS